MTRDKFPEPSSEEKLKHIDIPNAAEITRRIDDEFELYVKQQMQALRDDKETYIEYSGDDDESFERRVQRKESDLRAMSTIERIRAMLNNFRFWFKGGEYRNHKYEVGKDPSHVAKRHQDMQDIDAFMQTRNYPVDLSRAIAMETTYDEETRLMVMAEVYFHLATLDQYKGENREVLEHLRQ